MPAAPARAPHPPYLLAALVAAFVFVIGLAVFRSHQVEEHKESSFNVRELYVAPVPKPSGSWRLIQTTPAQTDHILLPGGQRVEATPITSGPGTRVWIKLPPHAQSGHIQATATFGNLPATPVPCSETDVNDVNCLFIPQNYPSGIHRCLLHLKQVENDGTSYDLSTREIKDLPPTVRVWPQMPLSTAPIQCGPARITARVWRIPPASPTQIVQSELSASMQPRPNEHWDLTVVQVTPPMYVPAGLNLEDVVKRGSTVFDLGNLPVVTTWNPRAPLSGIQSEAVFKGSVRRFETADEEVEFHNVRIKLCATDGQSPGRPLLVSPAEPISAISPTGVKVTLYPYPEPGGRTIPWRSAALEMSYTTEPTENVLTNLPRSPVAKGRNLPVIFRIYPENGLVPSRFGNPTFDSAEETRSPVKISGRTVLVATAGGYSEGILPVFKLKIRHRMTLETIPYIFAVPVLSAIPRDADYSRNMRPARW